MTDPVIPAGTQIRTPINIALENASLGSAQITDGSILNADVASNAAIAGTKVAPAFGAQAVTSTTSIGYATGAGGAITQETSKSTGVTLSKICGAITTHDAELEGGAEVSFTVTNTAVAATDVVVVAVKSGAATGAYIASVSAIGAGSFTVTLSNVGSTASEALVLNFVVIKAVAA
jgi:hypothetical protein